jgi:hypothetical protein
MDDLFTSIYKAFIYVSAILFVIALNTTGNTTINALLSGYSILIAGILLIMTIILNGFQKMSKGITTSQLILNILITIGPFLLILAIVGFLMYLLITYKTIISEGHVSGYYSTFTFLSSILILVQMYLLYMGVNNEKFQATNKLSKIISSIICLTAVLNSICVVILYIILKYYTTDGYKNLL